MKSFELQPTQENILATLQNNLIDRNKDVYHFMDLLNTIDDSCSIALDGQWGCGKTFFVRQLKMVLDAYNPFIETTDSASISRVKKCMDSCRMCGNEEIDFQPQVAVYYDAWSNDNDVDPILSIIFETIQSVGTDFSFKRGKSFLQTAGTIAELLTGEKVNMLIGLASQDDPLSCIKASKNIHNLISEFFESLLAERGDRLVVFIDELDRCKPSYAVTLLERIKHYFPNDRVTFVLSVNLSELQHTIKQYYGSDFNACRYLDRFFDFRVSLPPASLVKYYQKFGLDASDSFEAICREVINAHHFELRETVKFYRLAKTAAYQATHGNEFHHSFPGRKALQFCILCVVPILLGLKIADIDRYYAFINGKDPSPLISILGSGGTGEDVCTSLLNYYSGRGGSKQHDKEELSTKDKLISIYHALFPRNHSDRTNEIVVDDMSFSMKTHDDLMAVVGQLSGFADYSN